MNTLRFKKFTRPAFLRQIGRPLLGHFFDRFSAELAACGISLPRDGLGEEAYFRALGEMVMAPEGLPEHLVEAIYAIEGLANADGQERLERGIEAEGLTVPVREDSTAAEFSMQVWFASLELLGQKHAEQRLRQLSALEYFGTPSPVGCRAIQTNPSDSAPAAHLRSWSQVPPSALRA